MDRHAHSVGADLGRKRFFELAAFAAGFLKARGNDDESLDASGSAFVNGGKHKFRVDNDDRQIHAVGEFADGRISAKSFDLAALGVDRVDVSLEAVFEQALQKIVADRVRTSGGADDGDCTRLQDMVKQHGG